MSKRIFLYAGLLVLAACSQPEAPVDYDALSASEQRLPENAVHGMKVADGTTISLFASEPMLINPTNIHVDERGRVWVCEALNYRNSYNPENPVREEGDRILILEDTDGDGAADKRTVFYQGQDVNAALGIWAVGNTAIVSCSPNVFILTDTDGDNVADKKEVLFTGLGGEQTDHAVHAFVQGPDGKLYFNFGNTGEQIMDRNGNPVIARGGAEVNDKGQPYRQGMVFRCDPDGSNLEVLAHNFRNNYEVAADSYGSLWQSDNDDDGNRGVRINYLLEYGNYGYADEMTGAGWTQNRVNIEKEIPRRHWHQNDPGVVPNLLLTGSGSPSGITVYEGRMLPEIFQDQVIHAEPGHNVVRAYPAEKRGAGYTAGMLPLVEGKDQWFRPVDIATAPDGSLFIADWYDPAVGGHKFGDPERGRIYRLTTSGREDTYDIVDLDADDLEDMGLALGSPNLAVQAQARQALTAAGQEAEPVLLKAWENDNPRIRARALWLLGDLPENGESYLQDALSDANEDLRITALRALRQKNVDMLPVLAKLAKDPSPQVRREVAIALRWEDSPQADGIWTNLAEQYDGEDRWYLEALGIGADLFAESRFAAWKQAVGDNWNTPAGRNIVWRSRAEASLPLLHQLIAGDQVTPFDMKQYFRAFDFVEAPGKEDMLASLLKESHPLADSIRKFVLFQLDPEYIAGHAEVQSALMAYLSSVAGTGEYLELVRLHHIEGQERELLRIATQGEDPALQQAAMNLLAGSGGGPLILQALSAASDEEKISLLRSLRQVSEASLLPEFWKFVQNEQTDTRVRREALSNLTNTWDGQIYLIDRVDQLEPGMRSQALVSLANAWNTDVRQRARTALEEIQSEQGVELSPLAVLENKAGSAENGRIIYQQLCQTCHKADDEGTDFGPSLAEIGSKLSKKGLYEAILYPSSGISFGFEGYSVHMKDGSVYQGILESRTDETIVIRLMGGTTMPLETDEIDRLEQMKQSLMPEGLHRGLNEEQLIDLVEYLASLRPVQG